jgi:hypothetical protein
MAPFAADSTATSHRFWSLHHFRPFSGRFNRFRRAKNDAKLSDRAGTGPEADAKSH